MARARSFRGNSRSGSFGRRSPGIGVMEIMSIHPETNPVLRVLGLIIRLRAELTTITVVLTAYFVLRARIGPDSTLVTFGVAAVVVFAVPATRRFIVSRVWCVITRHRMRSCFVKTPARIRYGRFPFLLWSTPSPVGERVRVWLPAGLAVKDLIGMTDELAVACWATEARVTANRKWAALVTVDIVRRDPLAVRNPLTPPIVEDIDDEPATVNGTITPLPNRSRIPAPRSDTNGQRPTGSRSPRTPHPSTKREDSEPPVSGFGGMDVSDYI